jgi:hypothetical protein
MDYYSECRILAEKNTFAWQIKCALAKAAAAIAGESPDGKTAEQTTKRQALAFAALLGGTVNGTVVTPQQIEDRFRILVASAATSIDPADGDVDSLVSSYWDDMAGVTYEDTQTS